MAILFGPDGLRFLASVLVFAAVAFAFVGAADFVRHRQQLNRRLKRGDEAGPQPAEFSQRIILEDEFLGEFKNIVTPSDEKELTTIRNRLIRAGYRRPSAVRAYFAIRAGLALALALIAALLVLAFGRLLPIVAAVALVIVPALAGLLLPSLWLERQIQRRRQQAEHEFPDALDMLLVCIEAGSSIDQACRRVGRELAGVHPVLAHEFSIINDELWAGKERQQVFADFAGRIDVQDIRAFATVLRQSDRFGVSIADTIRVYADETRNKRILRAEEKANLMPVKLAMGSILFTIPPTMLIMAGPSLIAMVRTFSIAGH